MRRNLAILLAGGVTSWLLLAYPAQLLGGEAMVVLSAVACLLCLVPAAATLVWSQWALQSTPEQQLLAVLGGTGVRMVFVVGAGIAIFLLSEYFHRTGFLIWVVVFYLITLALEIGLLLKSRQAEASHTHG